ncbi:hypothetical protein ACNUDN_30345 [Mycobacterium sp. smrl_JER01]|uniref:hypothetical protein n=1 Tax=Mycobacterium sp. smrl_JER01 TaxID=3402633 RepID=UPI003ABFD2B5
MDELTELVGEVGEDRRPRIAQAAKALAEAIRAEADTLGTAAIAYGNQNAVPVLASLPPQTFTQSRFWRYQLATAADNLAADTDTIGAPIPRCTGEEMMLHLILRNAAIASGCPPDRIHDWPEDPTSCDDGWGDLYEYLFEDHDVLMLYEAASHDMNGLGALNMEPGQWFSEFIPAVPVPDRPASATPGHKAGGTHD